MKKRLTTLLLVLSTTLGMSQTFTEVLKAVAPDRDAEDRLGYSVAIDGNYAIIGAYGDNFSDVDPNMGSAYIFEKTGIDNWTFVQKINNSDQDDYDRFGWSVSIHGDLAVIGAPGEDEDASDDNTLSKAGSAYIFQRGGDGVWTEMQKVVPSDREEGDEFGWSVDIYDSTIVVGAHHENHDEDGLNFEYHAGSIYTFDLNAGTGDWEEGQKIVASDRTDDHVYPDGRPDPDEEDLSDLFGGSVAIWGDYLIAGAHNHDYGPDGVGTGYRWNSGAVYIFERTGGIWTEVQKMQPNIRKAWDRYGYSLDLDSNIMVVGAYAEDESEFEGAPLMNAGGAYIVERDGAGLWEQTQKLDASDRTAGDHFGIDVAIDGDYIIIGAEQEDLFVGDLPEDSISNAGAGYIFEKADDGTWSEIQKIVQSDRDEDDYFGEAVSISENTIFVGTWQHDSDEEGGAYSEDAGGGFFFTTEVCEATTAEQSLSICMGESYEIGESSYTDAGTYVDTLFTIDACDSIVTTNLTIIAPEEELQTVAICFGTTYEIGTSSYGESGTYLDTLTSMVTGCDSIVTTVLDVEEELGSEQTATICHNEIFEVGGSIYTESGTYTDVFTASSSCDSTVTTILTVLPEIDVTITTDAITLSAGDPDVVTTTFQWVKCDPFEIIDGATERTYIAEENGEYAAIIYDGDCADTTDCFTIDQVGLEDENPFALRLYPNPSNGQFTLEINGLEQKTFVTIMDQLGAVVYQQELTNTKSTFDLDQLSRGVYFLQLTSGEKMTTKRIEIQ